MVKKSRSKNTPFSVVETSESTESTKAFAPNPEAENVKSAKPRFSVTLNPDGSVDFASMREDTKKRLQEVLRDPKIQELLGNVPERELISDEDIKMLYDLVGMIEAYAFTFAGKIDFDIAQKHARFTDEQKKILVPSTKNVVIKHADQMAWAIAWKDEVILCMLLLTITRAKYEGARREQAERAEERKQENPATQDAAVM